MKYYVLEGTFVKDISENTESQKANAAHLAYLNSGFDNGSILVSGPKEGTGGGIIVIQCDDIEKFCHDDPLVQAGIQEYRITEFKLYNCQDYLRAWFNQ